MNKILMFFLVYFLSYSSLLAVSKGYSITPPFLEVEMDDEKSQEVLIDIVNNTNREVVFDLSVVDFGSLDDSGGVAFLSKESFSLAAWIELGENFVTVLPLQKVTIPILIKNLPNLTAGGHYGAMVAKVRNNDKLADKVVGISQSMATLFYVQKNGSFKKELVMSSFKSDHNLWYFTKNIEIVLSNVGETHVVPRGKVEIKNYGGKIVGKGILNEASSIVLPESVRKYKVLIERNGWIWPGKYVLGIYYRYDGKPDYSFVDQYFIYFGKEGLLLTVLGGMVVLRLVRILSKIRK